MPRDPIETIQRMTDHAMKSMKTKYEQMAMVIMVMIIMMKMTQTMRMGLIFLLYCLHIITVNVFSCGDRKSRYILKKREKEN